MQAFWMLYLYYSGPLSSVASSSPYIILIPRAIFLSQVVPACQSLLSLAVWERWRKLEIYILLTEVCGQRWVSVWMWTVKFLCPMLSSILHVTSTQRYPARDFSYVAGCVFKAGCTGPPIACSLPQCSLALGPQSFRENSPLGTGLR